MHSIRVFLMVPEVAALRIMSEPGMQFFGVRQRKDPLCHILSAILISLVVNEVDSGLLWADAI